VTLNNPIRSIAIGSFDGLHLAHQELISLAEAVVVIERNGGYLTPGYKRTHFTEKPCFYYLFETIRSLRPEAFIETLREDFPRLEKIVVGYDFHFGREKEGDARLLRERFDGEVVIVDEVSVGGVPVHSRTIKTYLSEGEIDWANRLLGREYQIDGKIVKGQGIGSRELVPTLNLKVEHYRLPQEGVYATRTKVGEVWYPSVSFLGHRVSTDGSFAIESHILRRDIGEREGEATIAFRARVRENRKFTSLEALREQIASDIRIAESYFV
jgi:riboflavin kinase/FMN adenylyltransferase